ncbi:hypothetical protein ES705_29930 [subsurface metagenome]
MSRRQHYLLCPRCRVFISPADVDSVLPARTIECVNCHELVTIPRGIYAHRRPLPARLRKGARHV